MCIRDSSYTDEEMGSATCQLRPSVCNEDDNDDEVFDINNEVGLAVAASTVVKNTFRKCGR